MDMALGQAVLRAERDLIAGPMDVGVVLSQPGEPENYRVSSQPGVREFQLFLVGSDGEGKRSFMGY